MVSAIIVAAGRGPRMGPDKDKLFLEVAGLPHSVAVRDSKNVRAPTLVFTPQQWATFAAAVKQGGYPVA